ncbi:hypothetical protein [Hydrogenothermus marinus]|uniref:Flagellar hook-length control protein FliK n=1 Tax=Hydrogenothermus marinus TaxID=133270 RepID=A0A3M0BL88_9AQUI|nr:hypothetical protein [Hydrogenothermus marinus]RMA97204.1 hypothetical protein CLV39_0860 [Hydrogenothermus marinus]
MLNFKLPSIEAEYLNIVKLPAKSLTLKAGENIKAQVVDILPSGGVVIRLKGQLVEVKSEIPLQKDTQLLLKILPSSDQNNVKLRLISILSKNEANIIKTILQNFQLKPSNLDFKSVQILNLINEQLVLNLNPSKLEQAIKNSGVFFESKIRKNLDYKNDLKFKLLKLLSDENINPAEKEKVKQLIKDIQQYQFLSKLTDSIWTFIPFFDKELEKVDFIYKKLRKNNKEYHLIIIPLTLKSIGNLQINILNFEKNLNISFFSENKKFLEKIKKNIEELQSKLQMLSFNANFSFIEGNINLENIAKNKFTNIFNIKV